MARLLLLDNHDSFTWNLAQYLAELGVPPEVRLNDEVDVAWCESQGFDAIVLSPGPGRPEHSGILLPLVVALAGKVPTLGVCLGHQAIAQARGARIVHAREIVHGRTSRILHEGHGIFRGLTQGFEATRYHSLTIDPATLPTELAVTARTEDGTIMGIEHVTEPIYGVQFHPESILTREGKRLLANFLELATGRREGAA